MQRWQIMESTLKAVIRFYLKSDESYISSIFSFSLHINFLIDFKAIFLLTKPAIHAVVSFYFLATTIRDIFV